MAACWSWISSPVAKLCVYGVCAFVLRCFSCSHTVLPKEHSLGVIFFSSPSSCYAVFFLPLSTCISLPCMIMYVTNNKEPWTSWGVFMCDITAVVIWIKKLINLLNQLYVSVYRLKIMLYWNACWVSIHSLVNPSMHCSWSVYLNYFDDCHQIFL